MRQWHTHRAGMRDRVGGQVGPDSECVQLDAAQDRDRHERTTPPPGRAPLRPGHHGSIRWRRRRGAARRCGPATNTARRPAAGSKRSSVPGLPGRRGERPGSPADTRRQAARGRCRTDRDPHGKYSVLRLLTNGRPDAIASIIVRVSPSPTDGATKRLASGRGLRVPARESLSPLPDWPRQRRRKREAVILFDQVKEVGRSANTASFWRFSASLPPL